MPRRQGESPRRLCTNFLCLPTLPPLICTSCNRSGVGSRPRVTSVGVGKMANPILLAPANGPSATNCLSHQPTPYNPRLPDNPPLPRQGETSPCCFAVGFLPAAPAPHRVRLSRAEATPVRSCTAASPTAGYAFEPKFLKR